MTQRALYKIVPLLIAAALMLVGALGLTGSSATADGGKKHCNPGKVVRDCVYGHGKDDGKDHGKKDGKGDRGKHKGHDKKDGKGDRGKHKGHDKKGDRGKHKGHGKKDDRGHGKKNSGKRGR